MRIKLLAGCGFLLNTILFATYYAVTKEALNRIDPIVFTFCEMTTLVPAGLVILLWTRQKLTRSVVRRGILLGSTLCLALFTIAIALKYTTATSTAFFPALNGFVAALIAWAIFREPPKGTTWLAGLLSLGGAALLIFTSPMGYWRGTLIAFLGGLFYTCYVFLCDQEQKEEKERWALFGVELLTTALWANLVVLLFGDWQAVHPIFPRDALAILYVAVACTFVPVLIAVLLQKYISAVTVSFIYILEPVLGAVAAYFYLGETLPVQGYIGGGLVVLGALIHTWGTLGRSEKQRARASQLSHTQGSWLSTLLYPGVGCVLGTLLLTYLGGLPPRTWNEVVILWPQLGAEIQSGRGTYATLILIQAGGWLVAWMAVLVMGGMACFQAARRLYVPQVSPLAQPKEARATYPAQPVRQARVPTPLRVARQASAPAQSPRYAEIRPAAHRYQRAITRDSQRSVPRPAQPPKRRATVRLSEQAARYEDVVWSPPAPRTTSARRVVPSTEPLQRDGMTSHTRRRVHWEQQEAMEF